MKHSNAHHQPTTGLPTRGAPKPEWGPRCISLIGYLWKEASTLHTRTPAGTGFVCGACHRSDTPDGGPRLKCRTGQESQSNSVAPHTHQSTRVSTSSSSPMALLTCTLLAAIHTLSPHKKHSETYPVPKPSHPLLQGQSIHRVNRRRTGA